MELYYSAIYRTAFVLFVWNASCAGNCVKYDMAKAKSLNIFYAYPSNPPDIGEGIEYVCKLLNASNLVKAITWKDADIVGLRVIRQVTRKIDSCDIFCCDLTYLNMNVLFELGYAISKNKRIFISSNTDIKGQHERFTSIVPIASIGYQGASSSC